MPKLDRTVEVVKERWIKTKNVQCRMKFSHASSTKFAWSCLLLQGHFTLLTSLDENGVDLEFSICLFFLFLSLSLSFPVSVVSVSVLQRTIQRIKKNPVRPIYYSLSPVNVVFIAALSFTISESLCLNFASTTRRYRRSHRLLAVIRYPGYASGRGLISEEGTLPETLRWCIRNGRDALTKCLGKSIQS